MELMEFGRIAGPQLAAVTRPGNISRGTLGIFASDSSAVQELHIRRQQLLRDLQKEMPHAGITGLRARLG